MKKKQLPKKAAQQPRQVARQAKPAPPGESPTPVASATATTTRTQTAAPAVKRTSARHRRSMLNPAAARGLDAVKYIRIHERRPYGPRGEQAIVDIVRQAAHLARLELDAAK